jgi:hypothetical protein
MSALRFRPATEAEREGVIRSQWLAQVLPRGTDAKDGRHRAGRPGASLSTWGIRQALTLLVVSILDGPASVLVAELEEVPGELLGWVAFAPGDAIHFVRVPAGYGRRGLATELVRLAGECAACTWLTPNGRAFLAADGLVCRRVVDKAG